MLKLQVVDLADGTIAEYNAETVDSITTGKASLLYSMEDIAGNGMNPTDILMIIFFKDGNQATFNGNNIINFKHE